MDVKLDAVYEHITSGTSEAVCPMDALKGHNSAVEWVSSSPDQCEPYCVDVIVDYDPPCAPVNRETTRVPHVPGRDPRDQLQRGDHRASRASAWPRSPPSTAARDCDVRLTTPRPSI